MESYEEVSALETIYIDVLLVQSLYVNYLLLRATSRLTHSPLSRVRCALAATIGSGFSFLIFLPPLPVWMQVLCKLVTAAAIVTMAFGRRNLYRWLRQAASFFCCSFLLAGLLLALTSQTSQGFATWGNSFWYVDFSLLQLILFTALAYLGLHLYERMHGRNRRTDGEYQVVVRMGEKTVILEGLADTGNRLRDAFSGLPVIVCAKAELAALWGESPLESLTGYRLLPCSTVTAEGLMPLFRPDEICIQRRSDRGTQTYPVMAMIGIGGTQHCAIFHPSLCR